MCVHIDAKEDVDAANAAYCNEYKDAIYCIGSVVGPHPFPMKRFVMCFFVFIDIFIILEYDLYNKSYFGGE